MLTNEKNCSDNVRMLYAELRWHLISFECARKMNKKRASSISPAQWRDFFPFNSRSHTASCVPSKCLWIQAASTIMEIGVRWGHKIWNDTQRIHRYAIRKSVHAGALTSVLGSMGKFVHAINWLAYMRFGWSLLTQKQTKTVTMYYQYSIVVPFSWHFMLLHMHRKSSHIHRNLNHTACSFR